MRKTRRALYPIGDYPDIRAQFGPWMRDNDVDTLIYTLSAEAWAYGGLFFTLEAAERSALRLTIARRIHAAGGEHTTKLGRQNGRVVYRSIDGETLTVHLPGSALAGRAVSILPDNDDAGRNFARAIAERLNRLGHKEAKS